MKQIIIVQQWDELNKKQQNKLCKKLNMNFNRHNSYMPNIGHLIEFLGEDIIYIDKNEELWNLTTEKEQHYLNHKELIDALFSAVKHKLLTTPIKFK